MMLGCSRRDRLGQARILAAGLSFAVGLGGCERKPGSGAQAPPPSVRALLLAIDEALQHGSSDQLAALILDTARIRELCPDLDPAELAQLEQLRAELPPSDCVALTDWSKLERSVPRFPAAQGLNVGTRVCDEAWNDCAAITRMCKSEIFYIIPETPDAGFKVNVNWVVRVGDEYWLSRAPRCMAKGTNAKR